MAYHDHADDHFQKFAASLTQSIDRYGPTPTSKKQRYEQQKEQMETLVDCEIRFREGLIAHENGPKVYEAFIKLICDEKRNILAARPFFRERQKFFASHISPVLKDRNVEGLYSFHFNYIFIAFALGAVEWDPKDPLVEIARKACEVRTKIVTTNMPLGISRARIFFSRTPQSHMAYMDFVQTSADGLMSAVDKYVGAFSKVFISTATGRMHGNFIENYSATPIHFYPVDKRKLYRANKLLKKYKAGGSLEPVDFEQIAEEINKDAKKPSQRTEAAEIADLLAASSCVSADSGFSDDADTRDDGDSSPVARAQADSSWQPDTQVEDAELRAAFRGALSKLSPFEQKILRLRGVVL